MRSMSSPRVTSMRIATWPSSAANLSTPAPSKSASTSRAPSPASRRAHAAPMPRAAPVINTVRPASDPIAPLPCASARIIALARRLAPSPGDGSPARRDAKAGRRGSDGHGRARDDEGGGEARLEAALPQRGEDLRQGGDAGDDAERAGDERQASRRALLAGGKRAHHRRHVRHLEEPEAEARHEEPGRDRHRRRAPRGAAQEQQAAG